MSVNTGQYLCGLCVLCVVCVYVCVHQKAVYNIAILSLLLQTDHQVHSIKHITNMLLTMVNGGGGGDGPLIGCFLASLSFNQQRHKCSCDVS